MINREGLVLALAFYACYSIFFFGYILRILMWVREGPSPVRPGACQSSRSIFMAFEDIVFLRRLLRINDVLWFGEWLFHFSLLVVFISHLRFLLDPVPAVVAAFEIPGIIAGWLLPFSLLYIGIMKFVVERRPYLSSYNFFLLGLLFALSVSGLLARYIFRVDVVNVKYFILGLMKFHALQFPSGITFFLHFIGVLVLLVSVPTHIFAAPLTMIESRQRDERLPYLMHEK